MATKKPPAPLVSGRFDREMLQRARLEILQDPRGAELDKLAHQLLYGHQPELKGSGSYKCCPWQTWVDREEDEKQLAQTLAALAKVKSGNFSGLDFVNSSSGWRAKFPPSDVAQFHSERAVSLATPDQPVRGFEMDVDFVMKLLSASWPTDRVDLATQFVDKLQESDHPESTEAASKFQEIINQLHEDRFLRIVRKDGRRLILENQDGEVWIAAPLANVSLGPPPRGQSG